jgi:hypothetical protein
MSNILKRLDKLDGGPVGSLRDMSDRQLDRLITRGMTPVQREKYRTAMRYAGLALDGEG